MSSSVEIFGIDLGTTNSLASVLMDGVPTLVPNSLGKFLTPSVVGFLNDESLVVGDAAAQLRVTQPERTVSCFKRLMGTNQEIQISGKKWSAIELSSFVLASLHKDTEEFLGKKIEDVVITVPAYFNDNQRKATQQAGQIAGLNVRRIVNEPTAAALTYGFHDRQSEKNIIVVDLGGGTFDVTIMEVFEGTLEIVSTAGITQLGGEDFTNRLTAWVLQTMNQQLEQAELKHPLYVARLKEQCEQAKRSLQTEENVVIKIPDLDGKFSDAPTTTPLSRQKATELFGTLIEQMTVPISKALRDSRMELSDIDEVILVGGATRERSVQDHVRKLFKKELHCKIDPDHVVALGAGIQAALIGDDQAVDDLVMTDVCPFTLGIEISKSVGRNYTEGGYFSPIIHRNTTIPVSKEEIFTTIHPNQTEVSVRVFQGESRKVQDNLLLGDITVTGIPPSAEGTPIYVRFTYDLNGILEVEAFLTDTGKKFRTVLANNSSGMSEAEIRAAVKKMQGIKFYPREDLKNRNLLLFAERAVGEVSPYQRNQLESAIDFYEHGMHASDKEVFESAKQQLIITLAELGWHWDENEEKQDDSANGSGGKE